MNKLIRGSIHIPCGMVKMLVLKIVKGAKFKGTWKCAISPLTEITVDKGGSLFIGENFMMRDGAKIRVRDGAKCTIGRKVSFSSNNILTCREKIEIGDNVQLSPNVLIYDHDHDFRTEGGVAGGKYKTSPIIIGNNVWVGANVVILRGTQLGDNCVVGAGAVLKGKYPSNSIIVQKRVDSINHIGESDNE